MGASTPHKRVTDIANISKHLKRERDKMEPCVGKSYAEIWKIYSNKYGDTPDTRRIHNKWKEIAAQVK